MFNKNTHLRVVFTLYVTSLNFLKISREKNEKRKYEKCILSSQKSDFFCHYIVFLQDSERDFYFSNNIEIEFWGKKADF